MKYKINRESKNGVINKNRIIGGVTLALAVGTIVVTSLMAKVEKETYGFDKNFNSYSNQLEVMLDVDINNNDAALLNKLQDYRGHIEDYKSGMGELVEKTALKGLIEGEDDIINTGLDIAKTYIAKENGGEKDDWVIRHENSDGSWLAVKEGFGNTKLSGDVQTLVGFIGQLQDYQKMDVIGDTDKFVDLCDKLIQSAGKVTVNMSEKTI